MIDRRGAIGGIGALAAAPYAAGAAERPAGKPPFLNPGDTVAVVSPASAVGSDDGLDRAEWWLKGMGLVPKYGPHAGDRHGYLAGTDAARAADLNAAYADPQVKAVFATRGGWGAARILPLLDWDAIDSERLRDDLDPRDLLFARTTMRHIHELIDETKKSNMCWHLEIKPNARSL